jgi:hypothetical protein
MPDSFESPGHDSNRYHHVDEAMNQNTKNGSASSFPIVMAVIVTEYA